MSDLDDSSNEETERDIRRSVDAARKRDAAATRLRDKLGMLTDRIQRHCFDEGEGFLFFLREPRRDGMDLARVELIDLDDGTWGLYLEAAPAFKRLLENCGFTLLLDSLDGERDDRSDSDSRPIRRG